MLTIDDISVQVYTQNGVLGALASTKVNGEEHGYFRAPTEDEPMPCALRIAMCELVLSMCEAGFMVLEDQPEEAQIFMAKYKQDRYEGRFNL
jgi:hypothetical protein